MNNLTTRKIVLGLLMALVLAFSVQGIAEALTFTRPSNSGDLQTVFADRDFTISFSVSLGGNTTRITDATGKLIKDSTTPNQDHRIDSSGYLVEEIDGTDYRTIETQLAGNIFVDPRPTYSDETPGTAGKTQVALTMLTPVETLLTLRVTLPTSRLVTVLGLIIVILITLLRLVRGDTHGRKQIQTRKCLMLTGTTTMKRVFQYRCLPT